MSASIEKRMIGKTKRSLWMDLFTSRETKCSLFWSASGIIAFCFIGAIVSLRQWREASVWSGVDRFSGFVLLISAAFVLQHVYLYCKLPSAAQVVKEAFGVTYDPLMGRFNALLLLCESVVFLDYARWHLSPSFLRQPGLQYAGIGVYLLAFGMVAWADRYLSRHFAASARNSVITVGPYHYVRHPRYAGLFLSRVGFALTFGSLIEWGIIIGWFWVVRRRIRIEERHLYKQFGEEYARYMRKTARLLPGVF